MNTADIIRSFVTFLEGKEGIKFIKQNYSDELGELVTAIYEFHQNPQCSVNDMIFRLTLSYMKHRNYGEALSQVVRSMKSQSNLKEVALSQIVNNLSDTDLTYDEVMSNLCYSEPFNDDNQEPLSSHEVRGYNTINVYDITMFTVDNIKSLFQHIYNMYDCGYINLDAFSYAVVHLFFMFQNRASMIEPHQYVHVIKDIDKAVSDKLLYFYHKTYRTLLDNGASHQEADQASKSFLNTVLSSENNYNSTPERSCWANIRAVVKDVCKKYMRTQEPVPLKHSVMGMGRQYYVKRVRALFGACS